MSETCPECAKLRRELEEMGGLLLKKSRDLVIEQRVVQEIFCANCLREGLRGDCLLCKWRPNSGERDAN
jgi:hypothetical protein